MVLIFHLNPRALRGGFVGVDVFFVISGYLIFAITRREIAAGTFSLFQFYGRRIRRLFPALLLMLTTVLAGGWLVMSGPEFEVLGRHLAASVLYVSNFAYWREAGYFDAASETKPLLHLWSLAIEEQFYVLWPVLITWLARTNRRFTPWTAVLTLASLVGCLIMTATDRTAAFYFSPVRFWEILIGCLLALDLVPARGPRRRDVEAWIGLAMIVAAMLLFTGQQRFPGSRALLPTLGAAGLIAAGPGAWVNRVLLSSRVAVWLGRISYPLYLWHWPVIVYLRLLAPNTRETLAGQLLAAALSLILAQVTYVFVERRAHRLDPRGNAWWMMAPWVAFGAAGAIILALHGIPSRTPELNAQLADMGERPPSYYVNEHCPESVSKDSVLKFCRQSKAGTPTHLVIGDSHANHVFEGVRDAADQTWLVLGNPICAPVLGVKIETGGPNCAAGVRRMLDYLAATPDVRVVVLSFWGQYASLTDTSGKPIPNQGGRSPNYVGEPGLNEEQRYAAFERGVENFLVEVEKSNRHVVLAHDIPELPYLGQDCIRRPFALAQPMSCVQTRAAVTARQLRYRAMMASIMSRHPRLTEYDPLRYLCDESSCFAKDDRGPLYFDRDHVGERGSVRAFGGLIRVGRSAGDDDPSF